MRNPELARQLLERAMKELPYENAFNAPRNWIHRAINELKKRETIKEQKQKATTPFQQWQLDLETGSMTNPNVHPVVARNALANLEKLIAQEQAKLNKTAQPTTKISPLNLLTG